MPKRLISVILVLIMILSFTSCSIGKSDGPGPSKHDDYTEGEEYPRVTYYDSNPENKYAAALQNSHLVYTYGEDHNDGEGAVPLEYEFLNCANYHYHRGYTLVGYDDARHGILTEPDDHIAIVFENGKAVLYDFYRRLIVDDYPYWEHDEDRAFLPICPEPLAFGLYASTKGFENTQDLVTGEIYYERFELSVVNSLCANPKGYELKTKIVDHGKADYVSEYTNYKFVYDTETEITLHADYYVTSNAKYAYNEAAGEFYSYIESELSHVLDVTVYEINTVKPSDVKDKITEMMALYDGEYRHITYSEYGDIFR